MRIGTIEEGYINAVMEIEDGSNIPSELYEQGYRMLVEDAELPNRVMNFETFTKPQPEYMHDVDKDVYRLVYVDRVDAMAVCDLIESKKTELAALDWMDIKNNELEKLGQPPKYAWEYIHSLKQPLRDDINRLEDVLIDAGYMEAPAEKTADEIAAERREYLDKLQLSRSTFIQLVIYCTSILPVPITLATIKEVSTMSEDADILFNYSNFIVRGTPLLTAVCTQYGVSEDMLDAMFEFSNELLEMKTNGVSFDPNLLNTI